MNEDYFPRADQLLELELRGLARLAAARELASTELEPLWLCANELNQKLKGTQSSTFSFHGHFFIVDPDNQCHRRVDIGAKVEVSETGEEYREVSYFFCIGEGIDCPGKILRKCHFDFEPYTNRHAGEVKPSLHFQFPGTVTPGLARAGYIDENLDHLAPWASKPRVACLPSSLILLLNLLFHEFGDGHNDELLRIVKQPWWRGMVDDAERAVYKPFFEACSGYWKNDPPAGTFLRRRFYGIED